MHDILEESWVYQEMVQKGLAQGIEKGVLAMQQAAIDLTKASFADLEALAKAKITAIKDLNRLQHLIVDLGISHTREQMECVRLSLDV